MDSLDSIIRQHAVRNAQEYGKANPGNIVGKAINDFPEAKKDMKSLMQKINEICAEVNSLPEEKLEEEFSKLPEKEKKEEKSGFDIPNAIEGKVVTRFPPEPSGYPHIGHAKAAFIDYGVAGQYRGRMLLRFDDTNPEKESQEFVDAIKEGLSWLGISAERETYTSDYLPTLYEYAKAMMEKGKAYVCTCKAEEISKGRETGTPCACRALPKEEQLERFGRMMNGGYAAGEAIVRYAGNLESPNTVMRDPSLFRIIESPHYRQGMKYRVWPSYDFAAPIIDSIEGITHAFRSKEYELRNELYFAILKDLEMREPVLMEFSRLSIRNAPISKRLITPLVKEEKVSGWDDPRLPTLMGLKRRGILPEAIRTFVLSFGFSKSESEPDWKKLLSENRKLLDPVAPHFFFVHNPKKITIEGAKPKKLREMEVKDEVWVSGPDARELKEGDTIRLKDLYNIKIEKLGEEGISASYAGEGMEKGRKIIQWVSGDRLDCEILKPGDLLTETGEYNSASLTVDEGYCEKSVLPLKIGEIVQFERYGFCRLDSKEPLRFVYSC
jgi:glutamyl-tRNA synthetase